MCLAIPGQVVELSAEVPLLAKVEVGGVRRTVNVALLDDDPAQVGDWVLIHVGFALSKISSEQAHEQLLLLRSLGEDRAAMDEIEGYVFAERAGSEP